jgi:hypothetical protein
MPVELDHLFICTSAGAPEGARLIEFGFSEGAPNEHPGQGTANRRFFFQNSFLELLWVADPAEAQAAGPARRLRLWERWSQRTPGASPFGVCTRPTDGAIEIPFPTWEYRPDYLPDPLAIHVGENSEQTAEPLLFHIAFGRRSDPGPQSRQQPREHATGCQAITRVQLSGPHARAPSETLRTLGDQCPWFSVVLSDEHLMELGFDGERLGKSTDFRPALALVCHW